MTLLWATELELESHPDLQLERLPLLCPLLLYVEAAHEDCWKGQISLNSEALPGLGEPETSVANSKGKTTSIESTENNEN